MLRPDDQSRTAPHGDALLNSRAKLPCWHCDVLRTMVKLLMFGRGTEAATPEPSNSLGTILPRSRRQKPQWLIEAQEAWRGVDGAVAARHGVLFPEFAEKYRPAADPLPLPEKPQPIPIPNGRLVLQTSTGHQTFDISGFNTRWDGPNESAGSVSVPRGNVGEPLSITILAGYGGDARSGETRDLGVVEAVISPLPEKPGGGT